MASHSLTLSVAVKMAALGMDSMNSLAERVQHARSSFQRCVKRFRDVHGSTAAEICAHLGLQVEASPLDSERSLREKRERAVLDDSIDGVVPAKKRGRSTLLSDSEERRIGTVLSTLGELSHPQDVSSVKAMMAATLREAPRRWSKCGRLVYGVSSHLVRSFFGRVGLSLKGAQTMDAPRVESLSKGRVRRYAASLGATLDAFSPPSWKGDNIWNLDETGFGLTDRGRRLKVFRRGQTGCHIVRKAPTARVSAMFAVSASGRLGPITMIIPRTRFPESFIRKASEECEGWAFRGNRSGFFDGAEFLRYMQRFVKFLDSFRDPSRVDIVVMDNLGSHLSEDVLSFASNHRIRIVYLPPHSTHLLQPLDVCLYGPLKARYFAGRDDLANSYLVERAQRLTVEELVASMLEAREFTLFDIPLLVLKPVREVFVPKSISHAFAVCGIWPFDGDKMQSRLPLGTPEEVAETEHRHRRQLFPGEAMIRVAEGEEDDTIESYRRRLDSVSGSSSGR